MTEKPFSCACCGLAAAIECEYDICSRCFWEAEGDSERVPDNHSGGPNSVSLTDARANYKAYGACDPHGYLCTHDYKVIPVELRNAEAREYYEEYGEE